MKLNELIEEIYEKADAKAEQTKKDYMKGISDCKKGVYDKWFRYIRNDDGLAYDLGWMHQNETTKNESVKFIDA